MIGHHSDIICFKVDVLSFKYSYSVSCSVTEIMSFTRLSIIACYRDVYLSGYTLSVSLVCVQLEGGEWGRGAAEEGRRGGEEEGGRGRRGQGEGRGEKGRGVGRGQGRREGRGAGGKGEEGGRARQTGTGTDRHTDRQTERVGAHTAWIKQKSE